MVKLFGSEKQKKAFSAAKRNLVEAGALESALTTALSQAEKEMEEAASGCVYMCVHVCIYMCVHVCTCVYIHVCTCVCCMCVFLFFHSRLYTAEFRSDASPQFIS